MPEQITLNSFYNTTRESGDTLKIYEQKANGQELKIVQFYLKYGRDKCYSPDEIHDLVAGDNTPLTSTRRAMTNLTRKGILEKTPYKKMGSFGRETYTWKLR